MCLAMKFRGQTKLPVHEIPRNSDETPSSHGNASSATSFFPTLFEMFPL
jgi:hypothetical protein